MQPIFPDIDTAVESLSAGELKRRLDDGERWTMLDTRRPEDFQEWQLEHRNLTVVNVPFTAFLDEQGTGPASSVPEEVPAGPLVTCCAKGISSLYVAKFLAREGWDVLGLADGMEGWATLYETREIATESIDAIQFHRPSSGCLAYMLVSDDEAAVVDPLRSFVSEYGRIARNRDATIRYVLDTHVHADHISGIRELAGAEDAASVLPAGATERGLTFEATLVEDGDSLSLGGTPIDVVGLPGHTTEMTGYRCGDIFLTGDTVFLDSVARPDLEDEERARRAAGRLWETLCGIAELPDEMVVGPGHVSSMTTPGNDGTFTATVGSLRRGLDAFGESREDFVDSVVADLPPRPNNFEEIIAVNLGEETVSSSEAFELELGPNNCAVDG